MDIPRPGGLGPGISDMSENDQQNLMDAGVAGLGLGVAGANAPAVLSKSVQLARTPVGQAALKGAAQLTGATGAYNVLKKLAPSWVSIKKAGE
jgi:hypothetical protein